MNPYTCSRGTKVIPRCNSNTERVNSLWPDCTFSPAHRSSLRRDPAVTQSLAIPCTLGQPRAQPPFGGLPTSRKGEEPTVLPARNCRPVRALTVSQLPSRPLLAGANLVARPDGPH